MKYESEPTTTGYYWMRWRRKYGRCWLYDVVWVSDAAWKAERTIRAILDWHPMTRFPNATFYGPIQPPEETP